MLLRPRHHRAAWPGAISAAESYHRQIRSRHDPRAGVRPAGGSLPPSLLQPLRPFARTGSGVPVGLAPTLNETHMCTVVVPCRPGGSPRCDPNGPANCRRRRRESVGAATHAVDEFVGQQAQRAGRQPERPQTLKGEADVQGDGAAFGSTMRHASFGLSPGSRS